MLFVKDERTLKENCISTALLIDSYIRHTFNEKLSLDQNLGNKNLGNLLTKTGPLPLSLDDSDNYIKVFLPLFFYYQQFPWWPYPRFV
jgi:hypothetical protein